MFSQILYLLYHRHVMKKICGLALVHGLHCPSQNSTENHVFNWKKKMPLKEYS